MDLRFNRACGAMIGLTFGHAIAADTIGDPIEESTSISERILALLTADDSNGNPVETSFSGSLNRTYDLIISAIKAGIATPTRNHQTFSNAVWDYCALSDMTRPEFQGAALVAAAISLGIDSANFRVEETLIRAVNLTASLEAYGSWSPEPDVLATMRRALNAACEINEHADSPIDLLVAQIGASASVTQLIPLAFALASHYQDSHLLSAPLRVGSQKHAIMALMGALVGSVRGADFFEPYGSAQVDAAFSGKLTHFAEQYFSQRVPYPHDIPDADEKISSCVPPARASFIDLASSLRSRQSSFEPIAPPVPLGALRGKTKPGRVLVLGELLMDHALRSEKYPSFGSDVWARDLGQSPGGTFRALISAQRMGVQVVSLCPLGQGPIAGALSQVLEREGIVDAGPRLAEGDNRYQLHATTEDGRGLNISTNIALPDHAARTWAQAIAAMGPSDVLFIDGSLLADEAYAHALSEAVRWLPEHARVVFDASSHEGFVPGLPLDNLIISVRASRLPQGSDFLRYFIAGHPYSSPLYDYEARLEHQASALALLTQRHVVVRADSGEVCFARPTRDDQRVIRPAVTRIAAPSLTEEQAVETSGVHAGTLAAALALGIPAERGILFANCAASLATPASLSARDAIEAEADELLARDLA
ncbi:MAG: carbohydrate kinase [Actinomyces sp.]|nr:carbohydrate kinase [Actinomyces sp.]